MEVRCPQCHDSIDLPQDASLSDIACPSCGSSFSLLGNEETIAYDSAEARTLGHFDLMEQIGAGAFAVVFKARDRELDRTVAVKIPRKGKLGPTETEQFLREARAAAQLRHPNIVSVHEVGREEHTVFIVSDHIDGLTLADWLTGQQLTSREAAKLCAKIAEALHHAHESGVIHRDLKPANIMLDADGEPHVMDFGLARREAGEVTMTLEGKVMGTPAYMSPEQARGEAHQADRRTDVYSLGVILFELLTGEKPFRGNIRMLLHQVINEDAPSPRKLNGTIPRDLETICLKCLERDSRKRYVSAKDVADELNRFLEGQPIQARPIGGLGRAWRWCKRKPAVSSLAAGLVFVLCAGLAAVTWQWYRAEMSVKSEARQRKDAVAARETAQKAWHDAEAARKDASDEAEQRRRLLYVSDMNVAQQAWEEGNAARVIELLNRHWPGLDQEDLRSFEWYHFWRLCRRSLKSPALLHSDFVRAVTFSPDGRTLASGCGNSVKVWELTSGRLQSTFAGHSNKVVCVAFSPDGETLASASEDSTVRLWDVATATERQVLRGSTGGSVNYVAFDPEGKRLAWAGGKGVVVLWDVAEQRELHTLEGHTKGIWSVAFSPDGKTIASGSDDGTMKLWNADTGEAQETLAGKAERFASVAFSPDGRTLAAGDSEGSVVFWEVGNFQTPRRLAAHEGIVTQVVFSPDGQKLASAGLGNTVRVWDVASGDLVDTFRGHVDAIKSVSFSPDGTTLASGSHDRRVIFWEMGPTEDREILETPGQAGIVAFSPDGTMASGDGDTVRVWDLTTGKTREMLGKHNWTIGGLVFSMDGKTLASGSWDGGEVKFWDVPTGRLLRTLQPGDGVVAMALSPDGDTLLTGGYRGLLKLWDFTTGELLADFKGDGGHVYGVAFSPNGRLLAAGRRNGIQLWDSHTGELQATFRGHTQGIWKVAFSPDGRKLASASDDRTIRLWEVASGKLLHVLKGHNGAVCGVVFADDGRTVVSSSFDTNVKIWDVVTGETRATLKGHTFLVPSVAFSPDQNLLASASADHTIRLWHAASPDEVLEDMALVDLEGRIHAVAKLDTAGQRQVLDDMIDYLAKRVEKGLTAKEIYLAASIGQILADSGSYELASDAYQRLADRLAENQDSRLSGLVESWQLAAWEKRAKAHAAAHHWLDAVDSFTKAVAMAPDVAPLLRGRGQVYVRLGRWKEAVADHQRLVELTPANTIAWLRAAPMFVLADDREGYGEHCRAMLDRFGASDETTDVERTIKVCALVPDTGENLEPLLSRLKSALDDGSAPDWMRKWGYMALALAAHRAGDANSVLQRASQSQRSSGYNETEPTAASLLCLTAMSHHRLGESQEARHSLRQASVLIDDYFSGLAKGEVAVEHDWLIAEILRREAEEQLAGLPSGPIPGAKAPVTERIE